MDQIKVNAVLCIYIQFYKKAVKCGKNMKADASNVYAFVLANHYLTFLFDHVTVGFTKT